MGSVPTLKTFFLTGDSVIQLAFFFIILMALVKPLGGYIAKVFSGESFWATKALGPVEKLIYRLAGINPQQEMGWKSYCFSVLAFNLFGFLLLYIILRVQYYLPLNPENLAGFPADLAFNTAASFVTNTDWQAYSGEGALSYFSQMAGVGVQNFLSAATGIAVLIALIRGLRGKKTKDLGNFWSDITKTVIYILLPLSIIFTLLLSSQGAVQSFSPYKKATLLETAIDNKGKKVTEQVIPLGPAASQIAIKQLGTNGGGFFSVNSAHPFENPTPFSNFLEMLAILLIPAALTYTYGKMIGDKRQGWALLSAMLIIIIPVILICIHQEQMGNRNFAFELIDQNPSAIAPGGNMEGKETRFGIANSALWAVLTTAASNGSVNSMHDSFTPLGGLMPLIMMQFSEIIFGGVGCGLYGMIIYVLLAVFMAGLMVGRTPEYLNKKLNVFDIKMASIALLVPAFLVLLGTALAVLIASAKNATGNLGAQGFSEMLYAFTSAGNNNGSSFAGLLVNSTFYNTALGVIMLFSRFWIIIPILAIAGSFAEKQTIPESAGTLPTHTPLFVAILVGVIILIGVLTFVPANALGPVIEHLHMVKR